jgi:hypothetical protein
MKNKVETKNKKISGTLGWTNGKVPECRRRGMAGGAEGKAKLSPQLML